MDQLFDTGPIPVDIKKKKTLGERRKERLAAGIHPLTGRSLGPAGITCGQCAYATKIYSASRGYWKCRYHGITHGEATDLRISWPSCSAWASRDWLVPCDNSDCVGGWREITMPNAKGDLGTRKIRCYTCQGFAMVIRLPESRKQW